MIGPTLASAVYLRHGRDAFMKRDTFAKAEQRVKIGQKVVIGLIIGA